MSRRSDRRTAVTDDRRNLTGHERAVNQPQRFQPVWIAVRIEKWNTQWAGDDEAIQRNFRFAAAADNDLARWCVDDRPATVSRAQFKNSLAGRIEMNRGRFEEDVVGIYFDSSTVHAQRVNRVLQRVRNFQIDGFGDERLGAIVFTATHRRAEAVV